MFFFASNQYGSRKKNKLLFFPIVDLDWTSNSPVHSFALCVIQFANKMLSYVLPFNPNLSVTKGLWLYYA